MKIRKVKAKKRKQRIARMGCDILIRGVPLDLHTQFKLYCVRNRVAMRKVVLRLMTELVHDRTRETWRDKRLIHKIELGEGDAVV